MTDSRRGSAEGTSPLTHADAEALISARLDGPLDSGENRALLGHLASCDRCRAFATQMDMLATSVRDIPSLPPSAAVSRAVRGEIRGETSPVRRFGAWLTTSKSAPLSALAAAAVALALVSASVFGPLGDDGSNGPSVNAPEFAAMETETSRCRRVCRRFRRRRRRDRNGGRARTKLPGDANHGSTEFRTRGRRSSRRCRRKRSPKRAGWFERRFCVDGIR
ncbi:MAG: zf-HC2 domain-containing protein [Thermomicrobiales bacterium]